jgi:acetyl-CoA acetyltransferase family protein
MKQRYPGVKWSQFDGAEMLARNHGLERPELDAFGLASHKKAAAATREGRFKPEIMPLEVTLEGGHRETFSEDEGIRYDANLEGMQALKPLSEVGLLTAGTSSQISDGAAAVLIANREGLARLGSKARARIRCMTLAGDDPVVMLGAPIPATRKLLSKSGVTLRDIDLYEVNEAFASVPLAWAKALDADPERLNVNGGAIALGHPLGCTGVKLMTTLLHELERRDASLGLQTMCEGGGLANATLIERM